jgi:hypothetical protein
MFANDRHKDALTTRSYRASSIRRELGGSLTIGGLTLGGSGSGISGNGLKLGKNGQRNSTASATEAQQLSTAKSEKSAAAKGGKPAATGEGKLEATGKPTPAEAETDAGAGTENQLGRVEGETTEKEAEQEATKVKGEKSNGVKATEESEKFSEEAGITLNGAGNVQNLGGNLGITKGTDGSTSIGGENGINVAANGEATIAGNE